MPKIAVLDRLFKSLGFYCVKKGLKLVPLEYIDLAKTGSRSVRSVQKFLKMNAFHFFPFLDARVPVFNRRLTGKCDFS